MELHRDLSLACRLLKGDPSLKSQPQRLLGLPGLASATQAATLQYVPQTFNRNSVLKGARFTHTHQEPIGVLGLLAEVL
jgi:hypothetical protein